MYFSNLLIYRKLRKLDTFGFKLKELLQIMRNKSNKGLFGETSVEIVTLWVLLWLKWYLFDFYYCTVEWKVKLFNK